MAINTNTNTSLLKPVWELLKLNVTVLAVNTAYLSWLAWPRLNQNAAAEVVWKWTREGGYDCMDYCPDRYITLQIKHAIGCTKSNL